MTINYTYDSLKEYFEKTKHLSNCHRNNNSETFADGMDLSITLLKCFSGIEDEDQKTMYYTLNYK